MAQGFELTMLYASAARWLHKEPVKLGLATLAIAFLKVSMATVTPILAEAQSYGENQVNFTSFGAFSKLCGSVATCATAGALLLARGKKNFTMKAPLYAYAVIAAAAFLAMGGENQLKNGGYSDWTLYGWIVLVVMFMQTEMLRRQFSWRDWLVSGVFLCGCAVSELPWVLTKKVPTMTSYLRLACVFWLAMYLCMEALNQTYQDKLFCDIGTTVTEQVFFISLFATLLRIIGFLMEFRCLEAIVFHAKHPLSFSSVLLLSLMGAVMAFLMSYILQLCGALICVMIHQIMAIVLEGKSQKLSTAYMSLKWVGIVTPLCSVTVLMLGMLGTTMWRMQHNHHKLGKLEEPQDSDEGKLTV